MASQLNDYLLRQKYLSEGFTRVLNHVKAERQTKNSLAQYEQELKDCWDEFQQNHLILLEELTETHEYFTLKAFELSKTKYDEAHNYLTKYKDGNALTKLQTINASIFSDDNDADSNKRTVETGSQHGSQDSIQIGPLSKSQKGSSDPIDPNLLDQNVRSDFGQPKLQSQSFEGTQLPHTMLHQVSIPGAQPPNFPFAQWNNNPINHNLQLNPYLNMQQAYVPKHFQNNDATGAKPRFNDKQNADHKQFKTNHSNPNINSYVPPSGTYNDYIYRQRELPKLPVMKIPQFSGKILEWKRFYGIFNAIIGNNFSISNLEKFQYLDGYLEGDAKKLINHLPLVDESFAAAINLLKSRYDYDRNIIGTYINMILNAKSTRSNVTEDLLTLHDTIREALAGLSALNKPLNENDPLLAGVILNKLDPSTTRKLEDSISDSNEMPSCSQILNFLQKRARFETTLKLQNNSNNSSIQRSTSATQQSKSKSFHTETSYQPICPLCKSDHFLYKCQKFIDADQLKRKKIVDQLHVCINCLCHPKAKNCVSRYSCLKCNRRHHTLLHFEKVIDKINTNNNDEPKELKKSIETKFIKPQSPVPKESTTLLAVSKKNLLPTASIQVQNNFGEWINLRALIDSGSVDSFISEEAAQTLKLPRIKNRTLIRGIGNTSAGICKGMLNILITPRFESNFTLPVQALVLNKLTSTIPENFINGPDCDDITQLPNKIADPFYGTPAPIDMILGTEIYGKIIKDGVFRFSSIPLTAQNTELGIVFFGKTYFDEQPRKTTICNISLTEIDNKVRKFREMDAEDQSDSMVSSSCEHHFKNTHKRQADGRYKEYQLNTVTYGTTTATFLSVRALLQLALDDGHKFPLVSKILQNDFYVDDLMTGSNSFEEAIEIQNQLTKLLALGGFNLRKWTSNNMLLLNHIPEDHREKGIIEIYDKNTISTLGIRWCPGLDEFNFKLNFKYMEVTTKRQLLSDVASLFDPLGWISPIILKAKLLMQEIWREKLHWDDLLPAHIQEKWNKYLIDLPTINNIRIPRSIGFQENKNFQLHGFCDASEEAFAAIIYSRTIDTEGNIQLSVLASKTKVCPLKSKITLPRLELCGAVLLAKLMFSTIEALEINDHEIFLWSDSEITLAWINKDPSNWETFIANRVAIIQKHTSKNDWRHVQSKDNPADIASRGCLASQLINSELWWNGPKWLKYEPSFWPSNTIDKEFILSNFSAKNESKVFTTSNKVKQMGPIIPEIFKKCSSFQQTKRNVATLLRFKNNCLNKHSKKIGYLHSIELKMSETLILKSLQEHYFFEEMKALKQNKVFPKNSFLLPLNPCIINGTLRVGGRLKNSALHEDSIHPIILPKDEITEAIIREYHAMGLHGGTNLTLSLLRSKYWISNGKNYISTVLRNCSICAKLRCSKTQNLMGQLPVVRVTPASPFTNTGVDYAGPFTTKFSKGRGAKTIKGYVALFVCMATKAIHLELVSDLTSEAFLAAFKRFISRRGKCHTVYSDNGTNFVGANRLLSKELRSAIRQATNKAAEVTANDGISWKFNPPLAPHFGGLWEAGVKSMKAHLKRTLGDTILTFEEFTTLLNQVEACLNSRPITAISNDPNDFEALSPGHFLIGKPLLTFPESDISETSVQQRWKLITKFTQQIWNRWSTEYLSSLQQRTKWKQASSNPLQEGDLVLVTDENLPQLKWPLGRIVKLHPGNDGIARVATIKTKNGLKQRIINRLHKLPGASEESKVIASNDNQMTQIQTRSKSTNPSKMLSTKVNTSKTLMPINLITILILTLFASVVFGNSSYTLKHPLSSGIFLEELGPANLKRGILRLEVNFNLTYEFVKRDTLDRVFYQIEELCLESTKIQGETKCNSFIDYLRQKKAKIIAQLYELNTCHTRKRRGLLGSALNFFFGVNDEVYRDIDQLIQNDNILHDSINKQALLLNSRITASERLMEAKFKRFEMSILEAYRAIDNFAHVVNIVKTNTLQLSLLSSFIAAEHFYKEISDYNQDIIDAIRQRGNIHDFVDITSIRKAIAFTTEKISNDLLILENPIPKVTFACKNEEIIVFGYFQIIERDSFQLIHVTPAPKYEKEDIFSFPIIESNTIGINFHKKIYFHDIHHTCTDEYFGKTLCQPLLSYHMDERTDCVIEQLYKQIPKKTCDVSPAQVKGTIWKKCAMPNTWLFIASKPTVVSVYCKKQREEVVLNFTGVIQTQDGCYIESSEVILRATIQTKLKVQNSAFKILMPNISSFSIPYTLPVIQWKKPLMPDEEFFTPEVYIETTRLHHLIRHPAFGVTTVIFIILFILIMWCTRSFWFKLFTCFKTNCCKKRPIQIQKEEEEEEVAEDLESIYARIVKQPATSQQSTV